MPLLGFQPPPSLGVVWSSLPGATAARPWVGRRSQWGLFLPAVVGVGQLWHQVDLGPSPFPSCQGICLSQSPFPGVSEGHGMAGSK